VLRANRARASAQAALLAPAATSGAAAPSRVRVRLYHAPAILRSPLARAARALPPRARELAGVCHIKAALFDDDALWSGANLAETYLTKRQDRYVLFRRAPQLADATAALVDAIAAQSCAPAAAAAQRRRSCPMRMA
jgi:hypothetical protein